MGKFYLNFGLLFFFACATISAAPPKWINERPLDQNNYIGIAGSNTGNKAKDYAIAMTAAKADLASEMAVVITGSQTVDASSSKKYGIKEELKENYIQYVNANLEALKVAETYYTRRDGYWVYIKLNKAEWALIEARRIKELKNRVYNIINENSSSTFSSLISSYAKAYDIILESPYKLIAQGELNNQSGLLIDIYENQIIQLLNTITIKSPNSYVLNKGDVFNPFLELTAENKSLAFFPMLLADNDGNILTKFTLDKDGKYQRDMDVQFLSMGNNSLIYKIDTEALNLKNEIFSKNIPSKNILVSKEATPLAIIVNIDYNIDTIETSIKSIFAEKNLPVKFLSKKYQNVDNMVVSFSINLLPRQYNIYIAQGSLLIDYQNGNFSEFSYMSPILKDGGNTKDQAIFRLVNKLLDNFKNDEDFFKKINKYL